MLEHVLPFIPVDSEVFIEAFCGSCAVTINLLQTRPNHFKHIICSDINKDLINFWNYVKESPSTFKTELEKFVQEHTLLEINSKEPLDTDLENLIRFYIKVTYAPMCCINKDVHESAYDALKRGVFNKRLNSIEKLSDILKPVEFIHCSYKDSIEKAVGYNLKTCCFADPPYKVDFSEKITWYGNDLVDLADLHTALITCDNFIVSHSEDEIFEIIFREYRGKLIEIESNFGWSRREVYKYK